MVPSIELLKGIKACGAGEGPHWDPDQRLLYMVDVFEGAVIRYSPRNNSSIYLKAADHVSFIIPIEGRKDEFVIGCVLELLAIQWDPVSNQIVKKDILACLSDEMDGAKINDAKCDTKGRLWFGTVGPDLSEEQGSLYSFSKSEGLKKHLDRRFCVSNGLGFSSDNKKLYFVDSMKRTVGQYCVDIDLNTCNFEKVIIKFEEAGVAGMPDGLTVDSDDMIWVACVFGSEVIRIDPGNGKILERLIFDKSHQITSVAFGGIALDELYVTSGNFGRKIPRPMLVYSEQTSGAPEAGATYRVTNLGVRGLETFKFSYD